MNMEPRQINSPKSAAGGTGGGWRGRSETLRLRLVLLLVGIDALSILFCAWVSSLIYDAQQWRWVPALTLLLPMYLLLAANGHAYDVDVVQRPKIAVARAAKAFATAVGMVLLVAFSLKASAELSRVGLTLSALCSFLLIASGRALVAANVQRLIGGNPFSTVLICDGDQQVPPGDYSIMILSDGYFDPAQDDPESYDRLSKSLEHADRVLVVCSAERRVTWAHALKGANIQGEILAPELLDLAPLGVALHGEVPSVIVAHGPLKLMDRLLKRAFDLAVAAGALLVLGPLLILVALLVKLEDGGPVLFAQTRIGRGNKMFRMYKFRSMRTDDCDSGGARSTARHDDRVTRIGRLIRSTSIDELPQLLNVFGGDMSIVGPRPHALESRAADKLFWEVDRRYWHRHATKPGLTGLAQVRGYRGATHLESDLVNRLQADLEYLDHWSIWRDIKIIAMTFGVLLHRNAY